MFEIKDWNEMIWLHFFPLIYIVKKIEEEYWTKKGKHKIHEVQEGNSVWPCHCFMDHNSLVTLPPDNPGFCRYGKCEGVSLQICYRNHLHGHFIWENHTGSLFSSGNLQDNPSSEYNIPHYLFHCLGGRNYFYDYENDNIAHEK